MKQKLYAYIVFGFGLLLLSGYIQAHCCEQPVNHCKNLYIASGQGFTFKNKEGVAGSGFKQEGNKNACIKCNHSVESHTCDRAGEKCPVAGENSNDCS